MLRTRDCQPPQDPKVVGHSETKYLFNYGDGWGQCRTYLDVKPNAVAREQHRCLLVHDEENIREHCVLERKHDIPLSRYADGLLAIWVKRWKRNTERQSRNQLVGYSERIV